MGASRASHGWTWQYDYSDQPEINLYMVEKAAYVALDRWVTTGAAPPSGAYIETNEGTDGPVIDSYGNAIGGVRLPEMAVPVATYSGLYAPGPDCTDAVMPFDQATIEELYPEPGDYLGKFEAAASTPNRSPQACLSELLQ